MDEQYEAILEIAKALRDRYNRPPTEDEVVGFIMGDDKTREEIWNFGLVKQN